MNTENAADVSFGVVSTGTGSDFARSAGIPMDWEGAGSILMSPKRKTIDVGAVTFMKDGNKTERYFVNAAGIGFDASAVENTEKMPKRLGGTIPYMMGLLRTLIGYRNRSVTIEIDGKKETAKVLSIMVGNGNYLGGGMNVAPNAIMDDKLFDVTIIGDIGKLNLIKSLPMLYNGTIGDHPKVRFARASTVSVDLKERILVQADGELLGEGPVSFRIVPAALNIVI